MNLLKGRDKSLHKYRYEAIDSTGLRVKGVEEAMTTGAAHLALLEQGLQPVSLLSLIHI